MPTQSDVLKKENPSPPPLRLAELITALSLATDLGMGQPMEHAFRACALALRLGSYAGLSQSDMSELYYVSLLRFFGCTADSHETAEITGGDDLAFRHLIAPVFGGSPLDIMSHVATRLGRDKGPIQRARVIGNFLRNGRRLPDGIRAHCELAENLTSRLGLPFGIWSGLAEAFERWDGSGQPNGLAGEAIGRTARIGFLARDLAILHEMYSPDEVLALVRRRRGASYDPALVDIYERHASALRDDIDSGTTVPSILDAEPPPHRLIGESRLGQALEVFADFADLKSPFTLGHSRGVATLAAEAARSLGWDAPAITALHRASLVHDLGRVGVPSGIWDKTGPLSESEWERVRLHPYYTERILLRTPGLASLAFAGMHHERLDGSGYHRGSSAALLPPAARVLAAADAYHAMTEPRPHRPARTAQEAARLLTGEATSGRFDREAVRAVLLAAGHRPAVTRSSWPAGLSDREVEVLRRLCRGESKRQVGEALSISPSTADHHVRHIYTKIGVSTRAGAAIFAIEHDLLRE